MGHFFGLLQKCTLTVNYHSTYSKRCRGVNPLSKPLLKRWPIHKSHFKKLGENRTSDVKYRKNVKNAPTTS